MTNESGAQFGAKSTADEVLAGVDLAGKRFLVTGTSAGIGIETARALVARGAGVVGAACDLETVGRARADAGLPPGELKDLAQAAATSVWAAVVADGETIGGRYLEECAVAPIDDSPNPFADGVRSYALDADRAARLWTKSAQWAGLA